VSESGRIGNATTEATPESIHAKPTPLTLSVADGKLSRVKRRKNEQDRKVSRSLIARLNRDAQQIAWRFGLSYRSIEPERANVKSRYGICYEDGVIKIRLRHAVTGRPLRYSSLVSTLCHELAHLRYFNHGVRFRVFNMELLEFAREQGIYRPGRRASSSEDALVGEQREAPQAGGAAASDRRRDDRRPVQLSLF
jgi:WLM domain